MAVDGWVEEVVTTRTNDYLAGAIVIEICDHRRGPDHLIVVVAPENCAIRPAQRGYIAAVIYWRIYLQILANIRANDHIRQTIAVDIRERRRRPDGVGVVEAPALGAVA